MRSDEISDAFSALVIDEHGDERVRIVVDERENGDTNVRIGVQFGTNSCAILLNHDQVNLLRWKLEAHAKEMVKS